MKSQRALSPVVSSLILIAAAVAISVGVALWSSAMALRHMETEEVRITNVSFDSQIVTLKFANTGTADVVITEIRVASGRNLLDANVGLEARTLTTVTVPLDWETGRQYQFLALSARGNEFVITAYAS